MPQENTIKIYSQYVDLASPEVKKGMERIRQSTEITAKTFDSFKRSVSSSLGFFRKEIVGVMQTSMKQQATHAAATTRHARTFGFEITGMLKSLGSLRNTMLLYFFALRPFINIMKGSTEAMIEQEDAVKRLSFAMGLHGTYSKEMSDNLIKLSRSFQETTRFGDDMILKVMEKLITVGRIMPSEIEKVTQSVLDFAAATGREPVEAAQLFANASLGITTGLRRAGIAIDEATPKSRILADMIEQINKQMGGRARKDTESFSGKVSKLSLAYKDFNKILGFLLKDLLHYEGIIKNLTISFENLTFVLESIGKKPTKLDELEISLLLINKLLDEAKKPIELKFLGIKIPTMGIFKDMERELKNTTELEIKKSIIVNQINKIKTEERTRQEMIDIKIAEERIKQLKLDAQEDFLTQYTALESRRLEIARQTYEEDRKRFEEAGVNKLEFAKWIAEQERNIYLAEKAERRKHPAMESAEEAKRNLDEFFAKQGPAYINFMTAFAKGAENALTKGFINVVKGNFEGLKDVVADFGNMLLETMMRFAAQAILLRIGFASFLGFHSGGYIQAGRSSSAGYGKKFHSGGEVPATLLEGEGVVNRTGMRSLGVDNLNKLNRGEGSGGGTTVNNYYIQTIDERSFRERLQQHGDIYTGAADRGIQDNTSLRKTSQKFG